MMLRKKFSTILSLLLLSSFLTGCGLFSKPEPIVLTETVYIKVEVPIKERPKPLQLQEITFEVVSAKNIDEFLFENAERNGTVVFIAMDVRDYENLALNTAELRRYIKQQLALIEYYEAKARESKNVSETTEER